MNDFDINILSNKKIAKEYLLEAIRKGNLLRTILRMSDIWQVMGEEKGALFCKKILDEVNKKKKNNNDRIQ